MKPRKDIFLVNDLIVQLRNQTDLPVSKHFQTAHGMQTSPMLWALMGFCCESWLTPEGTRGGCTLADMHAQEQPAVKMTEVREDTAGVVMDEAGPSRLAVEASTCLRAQTAPPSTARWLMACSPAGEWCVLAPGNLVEKGSHRTGSYFPSTDRAGCVVHRWPLHVVLTG